MPKIDLKQAPYFNDFNEKKKYYDILFRPGRAVQVRELNQLQTQLQKQISRFGSHVFKNGAQVLPGGPDSIKYDNQVGFVKIPKTNNANTLQELKINYLNQEFVSANGVEGKIIGVRAADTLDEARLFVKYTKGGGTGLNEGKYQTLQPLETFTIPSNSVSATVAPAGIGVCASVTVDESVYYFDERFILVDKQIIFLVPDDPENQASWNDRPTAKVGLEIIESVITSNEDSSLLDNANGTENFAAPGADRLAISANLVQRPIDDSEESNNFIELLKVVNGVIQIKVIRTEYSVLEDTLARRTFDESGDYTVNPFLVNAKPFLIEDDNGGVHAIEEYYYETQAEAAEAAEKIFGISGASNAPLAPAFWLPGATYDEFLAAARSKLSLIVEPGKAYVKGYEIQKLAPTVVDVDKARDLRYEINKSISCDIGTHYLITNVLGIPNFEDYETVNLYSQRVVTPGDEPLDQIGTAKVLGIEYVSGTHGTTTAIYKLYLFDVKALPGKDLTQVKSLYTTSITFTADTVLENFRLIGSVKSGGANKILGVGTSWVTDETQKLSVGDYIRTTNTIGNNLFRVTNVISDTEIDVTPSVPPQVDDQSHFLAYSLLKGLSSENGLIYRLPNDNIFTIRGNAQDNIVPTAVLSSYSVRRIYETVNVSGGNLQLPTLGPGEQYADYSPLDYVAVSKSNGDWLPLVAGTGTYGVEVLGANVTIHDVDPSASGYYVIATVRKTSNQAKERSKTLIRDFTITSAPNASDLSRFSLGKADILALKKVYMSSDFTTTPTILDQDITDRYFLDNGQRDYIYDIGSIVLKPRQPRPTGRILVIFDYFTHGNDGNYFSVDSYPFKGPGANMTYDEIPVYNSQSTGGRFDLKSSIDFRPRVTEPDANAFAYNSELPRGQFICNYHFYLNRIDKLYLDKTGEFRVAKGSPDVFPSAPEDVPSGMTIYELFMRAFTATPDDCVRRFVDNRRYTMSDIGKLDRRLKTLEYYTALSLLEKETNSLLITDSNGNTRFKNGFIVDNFSGHNVGNVQSVDYRCSIDIENNELRPQFYEDNINLIEKNSLEPNPVIRQQLREVDNYQVTGDVFTLPYTNVTQTEQVLCSKVSNINPFAVFTFVGRVKLTPWSDEWRDTVTRPRLLVEDNNSFDTIRAGLQAQGTIWNDWVNNWTGKEIRTKNTSKIVGRGPNGPDRQHGQAWPIWRQNFTQVTEVQTGERIRSGIIQEARPMGTIETSLGSRVVDQYAAPFIRTRTVQFEGKAFLPNTRVYPFFDRVNVSQFCRPTGGNLGDPLITNATGQITGEFVIPAGRFETGDRVFRLTASETNSTSPAPASFGETIYSAKGVIQVEQETVLSTRQFQIVSVPVTERESIRQVDRFQIPGAIVREDPIAQSFSVTDKGGCFVTAIDIFFYSKDPVVPVKLQIRPLGPEGSPMNVIVPFGEVIKEASEVITNVVDLQAGTLTVSGAGGPWPNLTTGISNASGTPITSNTPIQLSANPAADMIPTRFTFDSPVYLKEGEDYAFVLLADTTAYNVWVCQYGPDISGRGDITFRDEGTITINTEIGTENPIQKDPYFNGIYFKSVNGRSWVQDQTIDIKFKIYKAQFDTSSTGIIDFVNDVLPLRRMDADPFITKAGSSLVRINHPNHGMVLSSPISSKVAFELNYDVRLTGTVNSSGTTVTGTGTQFLSELVVGSIIKDPVSGEQKRVTNISSNTSLTIASAFTTNLTSASILGTSYSVPTGSNLAGFNVEHLLSLNGFELVHVELDSYIIDVGTNATASGFFGGSGWMCTENKSVHTLHVISSNLVLSETTLRAQASLTLGKGVHNDSTVAYNVEPYRTIELNRNVNLERPALVSSYINEFNLTDPVPGPSTVNPTEFFTDGSTADKKSFKLRLVLRSTNSNVSPVIDSARLSAAVISNRIDSPERYSSGGINLLEYGTHDDFVVAPTTISPAVATTANLIYFYNDTSGPNRGKIKTDDGNLASHMSKIDEGKYLLISGSANNSHNTSDGFRVVSVSYDPTAMTDKCVVVLDTTFTGASGNDPANLTLTQKDRFIDELAPLGGSASAKYVMRRFTLARPSNALRISFSAYRDIDSEIEVYYKLLREDENRPFDEIPYQRAEFNAEVNGTIVASAPLANTSPDQFSVYESNINQLPAFIAVAVKLVMKGGNPAKPPRIKDLQVIAIDE